MHEVRTLRGKCKPPSFSQGSFPRLPPLRRCSPILTSKPSRSVKEAALLQMILTREPRIDMVSLTHAKEKTTKILLTKVIARDRQVSSPSPSKWSTLSRHVPTWRTQMWPSLSCSWTWKARARLTSQTDSVCWITRASLALMRVTWPQVLERKLWLVLPLPKKIWRRQPGDVPAKKQT